MTPTETIKLLRSTLKTLQTILDAEDVSLFAQELIRIEIGQINNHLKSLEVPKPQQDWVNGKREQFR